jgi:acyl carrier protein
MDRETFLPLLDEALEVPPGTLKGPEKLEDLENWNSMAMVSFVALVDEHFNYTVSPRQFVNCETVDDLLALIKPLKTSA